MLVGAIDVAFVGSRPKRYSCAGDRSNDVLIRPRATWIRTEPGLLLPLHLDGQAEVGQLHRRVLTLTGQQQVLWLGREKAHTTVITFTSTNNSPTSTSTSTSTTSITTPTPTTRA